MQFSKPYLDNKEQGKKIPTPSGSVIPTSAFNNLYRYVGNNPTRYLDPLGLSKQECGNFIMNIEGSSDFQKAVKEALEKLKKQIQIIFVLMEIIIQFIGILTMRCYHLKVNTFQILQF
jgi:hypothetical protein